MSTPPSKVEEAAAALAAAQRAYQAALAHEKTVAADQGTPQEQRALRTPITLPTGDHPVKTPMARPHTGGGASIAEIISAGTTENNTGVSSKWSNDFRNTISKIMGFDSCSPEARRLMNDPEFQPQSAAPWQLSRH